jgi:exonuclease SbcC
VKETLEPIQKDIQENLKLMGIQNEFYFRTESERGKEIFQFGWKDIFGDRRNFDALSTGQQMILLIAMMTTFIEKANPNIKVLAIDNIENLDKLNFDKVIKGLNEIENKLDNIILSGVIDVEDIEGFKVWNLSQKAGEQLDKSA